MDIELSTKAPVLGKGQAEGCGTSFISSVDVVVHLGMNHRFLPLLLSLTKVRSEAQQVRLALFICPLLWGAGGAHFMRRSYLKVTFGVRTLYLNRSESKMTALNNQLF